MFVIACPQYPDFPHDHPTDIAYADQYHANALSGGSDEYLLQGVAYYAVQNQLAVPAADDDDLAPIPTLLANNPGGAPKFVTTNTAYLDSPKVRALKARFGLADLKNWSIDSAGNLVLSAEGLVYIAMRVNDQTMRLILGPYFPHTM